MYLFTLALLSAAMGYLLATGRFGRRVDETTGRARSQAQQRLTRLEDRFLGFFRRPARTDALRAWVLGPAAASFPEDFKSWLAGLSEAETHDFSRALDEYAASLGFSLNRVVEGGLDHDPIMRQVFVEAVVVYSPAYRKVRKAQQQAAQEAERNAPPPQAEVQAAEKSPSRRKNHNGAKEASETAAAD